MSAPQTTAAPPLLALRDISVRFGSLQALDAVSLELAAGEIRAILGENGAGKSTLMNVVYGLTAVVPAGSGEIRWRGESVRIESPLDARRLGIGMVHQELALVDALTVTENLALADGGDAFLIDYDEVGARARRRAGELGLDIGELDARTGNLPVGVRQRIEILRAVMREVRLLILDEPTAVLTPAEIEQLFAVIRALAARGVAVLLITHKLREVTSLADSVTVLRNGRVVAERPTAAVDEDELAALMVGRDLAPLPAGKLTVARHLEAPRPALRTAGLSLAARDGTPRLRGVDLEVLGGEIVGIAGVDGNGQTELFEVLSGLRPPTAGSVVLGDGGAPPRDRRAAGVSLIPPERRREGAVLEMSVWENAVLDAQLLDEHSPRGLLDGAAARRLAAEIIHRYRIVCDGPEAPAASLSGGNLQKLIVGRALCRRPRLVLAFNPTRGLDVGAARDVYAALGEVLEWGGSVLLLSTDLDEVMMLSHRIMVLYRGRLGAPLAPPYDRAALGRMMGGLGDGAA